MKAESFNRGWKVRTGIDQPFDAVFAPEMQKLGKDVVLPQDAMILEERDRECQNKYQTGFYPSKTYTYIKSFLVPESWKNTTQIIEFEGIMSKAMVYINGNFAASHKYGYSSMFVNMTPYLLYGQENRIKVVSHNSELSSRWYSGSGIYRDVALWQGGKEYIMPEQARVTTERIKKGYAVLRIDYRITNDAGQTEALTAAVEITDKNGKKAAGDVQNIYVKAGSTSDFTLRITVDNPMLWSVDTPDLYNLNIRVCKGGEQVDLYRETFGIRTLELDARNGLCINGEEVKLRGACIHHDNGIIGATTLYKAEEFRIRKLKEAGFNSIRCAHNPASKALLRACDNLGVLVMDELIDMWHEPKNENDWSVDFAQIWEEETERMVSKDYNHPSVVLYSTGNEIPELSRSSGVVMNQQIAAAIRRKDATRYVTSGISGLLAVIDRIDEYTAGMHEVEERVRSQAQEFNGGGGSEELNSLMGAMEQQKLDAFSVSGLLTECLEPVEGQLDVIGYNYLTARHEFEHTLHPDRVIVGSETYPPEIPSLWRIVMRNPYVIGDFSWTGYDYIGEAGIGIFHYDEKIPAMGWYPDRLASLGDIDINGTRRTISYLRETAYGLRKTPYLVVERVDKQGCTADTNNWKYSDSIHSWTFPGYEGKTAKVHILSGYSEVELFLNGKSLGRRQIREKDDYTTSYTLTYETGELRAVAYENGEAVEEDFLVTAGSPSAVRVELSQDVMCADGMDVCFATIDLLDSAGYWSRFEARKVSVSVEGVGRLIGFGSADPSSEEGFQSETAMSYDGRVMAAVRSGFDPGQIELTVEAEGCPVQKLHIEVK